MFYTEILRARNTLQYSLLGLVLLGGAIVLAGLLFPSMRFSPHEAATAVLVVGWSAALVTAIIASILGGSLAAVNCGHLELALTKPISRTKHVAGIFAVDLICLTLIFALVFGAAYLVASFLCGTFLAVSLDGANLLRLARFFAFPMAWFGLAQALTAGIRGQWAGSMIGISWPVTEALSILVAIPLLAPWRTIVSILNLPNPIAYFPFWSFDEAVKAGLRPQFGYGVANDAFALAAIAVVGLIVAAAQWRRVEA